MTMTVARELSKLLSHVISDKTKLIKAAYLARFRPLARGRAGIN